MKQHSENPENATCDNNMLANRLLKFRAWVENQNYMAVQGTPDLETLSSFMHHYSDSKNLMQFTGSVDNKGKEIYEGDIVKLSDAFFPRFRQIIFDYYGSWYIGDLGISFGQIKANGFVDCEVIGNIFENPELLQTTS